MADSTWYYTIYLAVDRVVQWWFTRRFRRQLDQLDELSGL